MKKLLEAEILQEHFAQFEQLQKMCEQTQMEVQREIDQQFTLKDKFFKELEKKDFEIKALKQENESLMFKYENG